MKVLAAILNDLKLSKFYDIWTINKTHNNVLAHELKMHFKFQVQAFLMLLKKAPPCSGEFIFTRNVCWFYIMSTKVWVYITVVLPTRRPSTHKDVVGEASVYII